MANILINAIKSKTGGGKNILENFLSVLSSSKTQHNWFILTPKSELYKGYSYEKIKIIDINKLFRINIFFPLLYFYEVHRIIHIFHIDLIFNFGDIIIPNFNKQIYFFDWAYAVYTEKYIWNTMTIKDYIVRKTKVFLIKKYINNTKLVISQTQNMANRLKEFYNVDNTIIIPTPLGIEFPHSQKRQVSFLPKKSIIFLFPANFASHKNFEILIPLGKLIKKKGYPFVIILTIEKNKKTNDFLKRIDENNLRCLVNIGKQNSSKMPSLFLQSDALLLPTLLESYGLPYIEAMAFGLPIITSNLDFAHEVCGDLAYYFDPFNEKSMLQAMYRMWKDDNKINKIALGKRKVANLPTWKEVFKRFELEIENILNQ